MLEDDGGRLVRDYILEMLEKKLSEPLLDFKGLSFKFASRASWPFGTMVRHKAGDFVNSMVLVDDGTLVSVLTLPKGEIVQTGRSIWEPDTP